MALPVWCVEVIKRTFKPALKLVPLTRLPLVGALVERLFFSGDRVVVVPSPRVVQLNRELGDFDQVVLPTQVLEHFIRAASQRWLMDFCICREGNSCEHYPRELGCLFLGQATAGINPRLGRPVSVERALSHLERCREAGLIHLVGRVKLDTFWLNVGPSGRLLTICSCCPCCCISRMLPHTTAGIRATVKRMPGLTVSVTEACQGCGGCLGTCFVEAIDLDGERAVISDDCRGCGRCVTACPNEAIELRLEDPEGAVRAIGWIGEVVDVS